MNKVLQPLLDIQSEMEFLVSNVLNKEELQQNPVLSRATDRSFQIIGEATKKIPQDFKDDYEDIPWKKMAGMRDVIVHEYDEIDIDQVWEAIQKDIPETLPKINELIEEQS